MAVETVTCYYNTGFDAGNIPSSPNVLANATSKSFPSVWKLQDRGLATVKISTTWDNIKDVDYVKLGSAYYTVAGIRQYNGVAELSLVQDDLNTAGGINSFTILDGWVERCSHASNNMFSNTLPVDFTPTQPYKIDGPFAITPTQLDNGVCFIGSTCDLDNMTDVAKTYTDSATNSSVTVPSIPAVPSNSFTSLCSNGHPSSWSAPLVQYLPNMGLYSFFSYNYNDKENPSFTPNRRVGTGVETVRSLGVEDCITACYMVPSYYGIPYVKTSTAGGFMDGVNGQYHNVNFTSIPWKYGTYVPKNNRVYACGNTYTIMSIGSGDQRTFEAIELYNSSNPNCPTFYVYADPAPNGKPYCQPSHYDGRSTSIFEQSVKGCEWLSTPITFREKSGWLSDVNQYGQNFQDTIQGLNRYVEDTLVNNSLLNGVQMGAQRIRTGVTGVAAGLPEIAGLSALEIEMQRTFQDARRDIAREQYNLKSSAKIVAPDVKFPQDPSIQGYVGNGFICYRTRLSDADMERLDNEFTMYGEPDNRKLTTNDLSSHQHFNFVKANNVSVKGNFSMSLRNGISSLFAGGIRLWHELPNQAALTNNPLKS